MTNKTYDVLVYIAQIALPAAAVLYLALAGLWGLPYAEQISGTIMALDAFMGALLKISSVQYHKQQAEARALEESEQERLRSLTEDDLK